MPLGFPGLGNGGGPQGVTQLTAGANITLSPTGGVGNVTITSTGGGSGGSYTEVANYAALPSPGGVSGSIYVTLASQGTYFVNRYPAGFYYSTGSGWTLLSELTQNYFNDSNFQLYDNADPTKTVTVSLAGLSTGTDRVWTAQDKNITVAGLVDVTVANLGGNGAYSVLGNSGSASASSMALQTGITLGAPGFTDAAGTFAYQQTGNINSYYQLSLQNTSSGSAASADVIIGGGAETSSTFYLDLGVNGSGFTGSGNFQASSAAYLYSQSADLSIGTQSANAIHFIVGGAASADAVTISSSGAFTVATLTTAGLVTNTTAGLLASTTVYPTTAPSAGQLLIGNSGSSAFAEVAMKQDGTISSSGALTVTGFNGTSMTASAGTGFASFNWLPYLQLVGKTVSVLTSGASGDLGSVNIPAGITRWRPVFGVNGGVAVLGETAANLSGHTFRMYTGANGTGTQLSASDFTGPNGAVLVLPGALSNTSYNTGSAIYLRQTDTSTSNAGTISFYVGILPLN